MMASSYNAKEEDGHHSGASSGTGVSKNKKPDNTAFKQQRLPAWQPILTAGSVLPAFFVIGLIFIPIGIGLFVTSNNIKEFQVQSRSCPPLTNSSRFFYTARCSYTVYTHSKPAEGGSLNRNKRFFDK